jgi:hypothetical protein
MTRGAPVLAMAAALGCAGGGGGPGSDHESDAVALTAADLGRSWAELAVPRAANEAPHIVRDPQGFVALIREVTGSGKVVGVTNNYLYRSNDGITWHRLPLPSKPDYFGLRDLTYGGGRYLMVGNWGNANEIWASTDLAQWSKQTIDLGWPLFRLKRTNQRFFALSVFRDFLLSDDGIAWTVVPSLTVQQEDVTSGNGLYVLVGSGPIRTSRDGKTWEDRPLDCALPGACIQDPSGGVHQGPHFSAVFAEGRYYVDQLVSSDGASWEARGGPRPIAAVDGYLFGTTDGNDLQAWRAGEAPVAITPDPPVPLVGLDGPAVPEIISAALPGGETCLTRRCLVVGDALYLIR